MRSNHVIARFVCVQFIANMQKLSKDCVLQHVSLESPIGDLVLSGCDKGLHTLSITLETVQSVSKEKESDQAELSPELKRCVKWIQSYFSSAQSVSTLPSPALHHPLLHEDSFTGHVLRMLLERVQVGQTISYKQLGEMAGNPKAARAVGSIMRRNPIPLIVPCHRVLCSSGAQGKYMGGKGDRIKMWLLSHEKQKE